MRSGIGKLDGRILKKRGCENLDWFLMSDGVQWCAIFLSDFAKGIEFLEQLRDHKLLKKYPALM